MKVLNHLLEIYELKNLIRYNNKIRVKDENVAEHSFFTALITLMLCDEYHVSKDKTCECLAKALLHDMPEIKINDITHDVKERLHLDEVLKSYEDEYYDKYFPAFSALMKDDAENQVNLIVKLADAISVMQFVENEHRLGNSSRDMLEIYKNACKRVDVLERKLKNEKNQ